MKYISALFLTLLIAPFAFAQSDVLELIQKSTEGKEVLDNVFLQVSVAGPNIEINKVRATLKAIDGAVRRNRVNRHKLLTITRTECKADLKALKNRFHDLTLRALAAKRALDGTLRRQKRQNTFFSRASEELSHYRKFRAMIVQNRQGWEKFWGKSRANIQKILSLLNQASVQLKALRHHYKKAALIQLPESYSNALTEIRSEFENTFDNLDGLRPIISNLLEIVRNHKHLNNGQVRQHVRSLLRHITGRLNEKLNEFEEENEHQGGLFESLDKLFDDAIRRGDKVVSALVASLKRSGQKVTFLQKAVKASEALAQAGRNVVGLRARECRHHHNHNTHLDVKAERILAVVSQLQEVIGDRWSSLHGFFLQKMDSESPVEEN